ncbi:cytidine deaminase [Actinopolymorpha sp. B11F2]|uniref:cytidine deaminase n=1 Tax=Actinopolymorpha sp. B11F2 TaxID=3160862 RepID=UPI0032E41FEF
MTSQELDPEDAKIVTLARATRSRAGSAQGAAVRDTTGRTYTAATVSLSSLQLSALRLAVAMAVSSGAEGLEAAAVVAEEAAVATEDVAAVRDLGGEGVPILLAGTDGSVTESAST